ncbi:MAG: hypothetical protein J1F35_00745 [Erysipelotrichales bacterium]|nr:hypothetical protein [Erysipelotrichales bacterium]
MRIGIDIDGVLVDIESFELDYFSKYYFMEYNKVIKNPKGYGSFHIFNGSPIQDRKLWSKLIHLYIKEVPRRFASEVIKKLREDGNEIYVITNRSANLSYVDDINRKQMEDIVIKWLKKYNIAYDKILFTHTNKLDVCKKENIDIMIEDKPLNINKISRKIPVLCFDALYNENCCGKNIYRVYSWYDIYAKIEKLKNSKL